MSGASPFALRAHERSVAGMLADPECTGDLLLIGLAVARHIEIEPVPPSDTNAGVTWTDICGPWLGESASGVQWRIDRALRKDIRRYDALVDAGLGPHAARCTAPMIRRDGPCGNRASEKVLVTDAATGRRSWLAACSRHREWHARAWAEARKIQPTQEPPANTGGVLPRHIPRVDWAKTWRRLNPKWTPPPEAATRVQRPNLRLLTFAATPIPDQHDHQED